MKTFKILSVIILGMIILTVAAGIAYSIFFRENITKIVVNEINKRLTAPLTIEKIKLNYLSNFPDMAVQIKNSTLYQRGYQERSPDHQKYIEIENLYLEFNIFDFIRKDYNLKEIHLQKVHANITPVYMDQVKTSFLKSSQVESRLNIHLEKLDLSDVHIKYHDPESQLVIETHIKKASITGNFYQNIRELIFEGNLFIEQLEQDGVNYMKSRKISVNSKIIDDTSSFTVPSGIINISGIPFQVRGNFEKKKRKINYVLSSSGLELKDFLDLLPKKYVQKFSRYKSAGSFSFNALFYGNLDENPIPGVTMTFQLQEGSMKDPDSNIKLNNLILSGVYNNGPEKNPASSIIDLETLSFNIGQSAFDGAVSISNLLEPVIQYNALATTNAADIAEFFDISNLKANQGEVLADLSGTFALDEKNHISDYDNLQGKAIIKDLAFSLYHDSIQVSDLSGELIFWENSIDGDFHVNINHNDIRIGGINEKSDIIEEQGLFEFELNARRLTYEDVLLLQRFLKSQASPENPSYGIRLSAHVDTFLYHEFEANHLESDISYVDKKLVADFFTFQAIEGVVHGNAAYDFRRPGRKHLQVQTNLNGINIHSLFKQFRNFNQKTIQHDNLKGYANGEIDLSADFGPAGYIPASLLVRSDISIHQGALIDFEPLEKLSAFIELSELRDISFSKLENNIYIENQRITFPRMKIESSAIDVTASGHHEFNSAYEYHLELLMSDILSKKAAGNKAENKEFGIVEDDNIGKMKLYLQISGNKDNMNIKYDKSAWAKNFKKKAREEKQELKQSLNKEFGLFNQDASTTKKQPNKRQFEINWNEDTLDKDISNQKSKTEEKENNKNEKVRSEGFKIEWENR